jgi:CheY-specific phosphatase CheX
MSKAVVIEPAQMAIVRALTTDACRDMFATLGSPVALVQTPRGPAHDIVAFIGFTGSSRGTLMIASSAELYWTSYPSQGPGPSVVDLFDWAAEVANQLLGRIKRRFCERGVDLDASTPTAARGRGLEIRCPVGEGACNLTFTVGKEIVDVCLEVRPLAGGKIFSDTTEPIECSREGTLVLF